MSEIVELLEKLAKKEGVNDTCIDGIYVFKASKSTPRTPLCYQQGFFIVGQGTKRIFLNQNVYEYNPDNYLVLTVPIPAECETVVTDGEPFLLLLVDINPSLINHIIQLMDNELDHLMFRSTDKQQGLFLTKATMGIKEAVLRLLRSPAIAFR